MKVLARAVVLLVASTSAWANPGLDVAVIIDRSKSMASQRQLASSLLRLSVDLLARNASATGVEHRIAIVSFGSSAHVDVPFTPVEAERWRLAQRIDRLSSSGHQGETDVLSALVAVERLFGSLPPDPARRRAIVVMTDGVPYVRGADMRRYREVLRQYVATQLAASAVSLDVLLLMPDSGSRQDALWRSLTGGVHPVDRAPADALAAAHSILTQLAGTPSAESAPSKTIAGVDVLVVPPYLEVIVFDVFRSSTDARVEIFPPDSSIAIRDGAGDVETARMGDMLSTLAVTRPRAGPWLVRKSGAGSQVRVRSQQFFPRGLLLQPDPVKVIPAQKQVRIAYRVLDGTEQPIRELPDYPLSLRVTLAGPDGTKVAMPMARDGDFALALFRSTQDARCTSPGRYWTDVRVTTVDAEGRPLEVFRDRWSGFTVAASTAAVQGTVVRPPPAERPARFPIWLLIAAAGGLLAAGLILRCRKTRAAASCLSRQREHDQP